MSSELPEIPELPREDGAPRDGVDEEDHRIPPWWWWSFFATVVFAVVYVPYYAITGWSQEKQYEAEVAAARARYAQAATELPSENPFRGEPAAIEKGEEIFRTTCSACHKPDGTGLVGPSLVDPYWKYGDSDAELFHSVAKGRPGGMPAWEAQLGANGVWKVLAYLETLPRSDEPGVGAPQSAGTPAGSPGG